MNQEIKKFYESSGQTVKTFSNRVTNEGDVYYLSYKHNPYLFDIIFECGIYYFNNKNYTEEEMLHLIRLKAFI